MKKIQKNYELNAGESFRLDKNGLHGVTAQGRFKMSCCWCSSKNICRTQKTDGFPGWRADGLFVQNRKILERKRAQYTL